MDRGNPGHSQRPNGPGAVSYTHLDVYKRQIDYVEGLGAARLADILINGEDEESDEDLLDRYMDSLQAQAYGGNKADYKTKVELLQGVGAVKVLDVYKRQGVTYAYWWWYFHSTEQNSSWRLH